MPYIYENPEKLAKLPAVGTKQCVALVQHYAGAPITGSWKQGKQGKGSLQLKSGTAIATFVDGRYPIHGTGNHAALYLSQDLTGIWVIDQWAKIGTIQKRKLAFKGRDAKGNCVDPSNNGDAFSVID